MLGAWVMVYVVWVMVYVVWVMVYVAWVMVVDRGRTHLYQHSGGVFGRRAERRIETSKRRLPDPRGLCQRQLNQPSRFRQPVRSDGNRHGLLGRSNIQTNPLSNQESARGPLMDCVAPPLSDLSMR